LGGLNASLSVASQGLQAQEAAISVTTNNIANANTPGYSREIVNLSEGVAVGQGDTALGGGVTLQGFSSVRDQLLALRIQQQTSQQSSADAQTSALNEVQNLFPSSGSGLGTDFSAFFSSISALSANPANAATRQSVLSSAQNLASEFNSISNGLSSQQTSLSQQVTSSVAQINQLSSQIATLNNQLTQLTAQGENVGTIQDQIQQDELSLSQLTNISITHTNSGIDSITTGNGTSLVLGNQSFALHTTTDSNGLTQVADSSGNTITASITGGSLGGVIQTRDTDLPSLQTQLDTLAHQFATAINSAQAQGYNQNGTAGTALFTIPSTVSGSAALISVSSSVTTASIAASSDGSSGSNGNVANLSAVATTALALGSTPSNAYASLVDQVGNYAANATAESTAIGTSLAQLNQQQSSESGVSIDQESTNLIQYQQAYEAAAKVISTISTLFTATLSIVGG